MKTKVLITSFLVLSLLGAFCMDTKGQNIRLNTNTITGDNTTIGLNTDTTLIADETTLTYTKTGAKIITFSEAVFQKISLKCGDEFKRIIITYRSDKKYGKYKEYTIYTSHELANNIREWAKKNL